MRRIAAGIACLVAACSAEAPVQTPIAVHEDAGVLPLDGGAVELDGGFRFTRLRIGPASPVLTLDDGRPGAIALQAFASDGVAEEDVTGVTLWRAADDALGTMGETTGRFMGSGDRAGNVEIEARYRGLTARATLKVVLAYRRIENGAPPSPEGLFSGPPGTDAMLRPAVAYPANQTTIPKNLVPMNVQWDAPASLDVFRVTLSSAEVSVVTFTTANELRLERSTWTRLLEDASPGSFRIDVEGTSSADPAHEVHASMPIEVEVAPALMRGTIYYWALNVGRILRIRPGAESYEEFFTPPPDAMGSTCVGCHTLSRDGQHMSFEYYGGWQTSGVVSVNAPSPPVIGPGVFSSNFSAFDPTGARLVAVINGALTIRNATDGSQLDALDNGGQLATHPAWSPDGDAIVYASQVGSESMGDVDFFQSDLKVIRGVAGMRRAPEMLVPADGMANTYPSFSPDGRVIAYGRGAYSRSHRAFDPPNHTAVVPGGLWMVPAAGGAPVSLARASDDGQAYLPAYSPFSAGGFTWIAFFSRKDYGRVTRGTTRRQIWVTAIDERAAAGADPSRPAFWLPAQDPSTENMSAYWAPDPCRAADQACTLDEDCCSGYLCRPVGTERRCVSRADACRVAGEPCASSGECCAADRLQCVETASGPRCARVDL